jgi:hypothetical protein
MWTLRCLAAQAATFRHDTRPVVSPSGSWPATPGAHCYRSRSCPVAAIRFALSTRTTRGVTVDAS